MPKDLEELAYELATNALAEQDKGLDELRSRTGTLLAASSLVASFLGARALDAHGFRWDNLVALCFFGATAILCVYVLFPRSGVNRSVSGPTVYEEFIAEGIDTKEAYRRLAYWIQDAYADNMQIVQRLFLGFRGACSALMGEVGFWRSPWDYTEVMANRKPTPSPPPKPPPGTFNTETRTGGTRKHR